MLTFLVKLLTLDHGAHTIARKCICTSLYYATFDVYLSIDNHNILLDMFFPINNAIQYRQISELNNIKFYKKSIEFACLETKNIVSNHDFVSF